MRENKVLALIPPGAVIHRRNQTSVFKTASLTEKKAKNSSVFHGDSYMTSRIEENERPVSPRTQNKQKLENLILNSTMLVNNEMKEFKDAMKNLKDEK